MRDIALLRLTQHSVTFELCGPQGILRPSEVLADFKIFADDRPLYHGKVVVSNLINSGTATICEATLQDKPLDLSLLRADRPEKAVASSFSTFLVGWQKFCGILPAYKLAVAEMQSFLRDLRLWMDQIELGISELNPIHRLEVERSIVWELVERTKPIVGAMFERFEFVAASVPKGLVPAHQEFCRRQLHPWLLRSPFMHRIYTKPLGYAGDYEMVNMILRDPCEGGSLFAKLLNVHIMQQVPAEAHRNRIVFLLQRLIEETNRSVQKRRICRIFNLGCGPAMEVQNFLGHVLSQHADFTLLDASDETLRDTGQVLEQVKYKHGRGTPIKLITKSLQQLLKQRNTFKPERGYDFVYSAGLFDYLNDRIGQAIIETAYDWLVPGGLLLITNVDPVNPIRNIMEHIYEWHLIYRNGSELAALAAGLPEEANVSVVAEPTSANVLLEVRKPL
ncbi:MAG: class I SAM-dependent methyltransferase [Verrucomicrobiales bacterium]|nr:class I SAM-dependent methyltransferase [Verrucomicrobiales bacterium]